MLRLKTSSGLRPSIAMGTDNVEFRLLNSAYSQGLLNMGLTALCVPIILFLMAGLIPVDILKIWGAAQALNIIVGLLAYGTWYFIKGAVTVRQFALWRGLFVCATLVGGVAWSVGPSLLLHRDQGVELAIYIGLIFTACAISTNTMAGQPYGMFAFFVGALAPAAWAAWSLGTETGQLTAVLLVCSLGAFIVVGGRAGNDLRDHFKLQTQLREATQTASAARELAESTSLAKSRFLANMSHELRSPLNAVIGAAQLLKAEGGDAESQGQLVDAIQRSGRNLLGLIENILDISRIEAGELHLSPADFHLMDCVDTALATAALAAQSKGLALACIVEPDLQPWRHGDALRLRQILLNLLGNAIKFTPAGDVTLQIKRGGHEADVHFSLIDTGVGISAASLPIIFEPFRQTDDGASRRFGGSGLGLSIVRQLVTAMGGTIGVQSRVGQGTRFDVDLTLPYAMTKHPQPESLGIAIAYFEPHEPSALALDAQLKLLGCFGHRVHTKDELRRWLLALAPQAGLPWLLLACDSPHAVIVLEGAVDLVDSECVIGMIRGETLEKDTVHNLLKLPRNIVKPVLRTALVSRLGSLRRKSSGGPMTMPPPLDAPDTVGAVTRVLVVEDDALNQLIVCRLLSHGGYETQAASDGAQALKLVATQTFDLILMDWQMPDMDGLEVTRRLRAGQSGSAGMVVPIVALTANAFAEDRAACLAAGMNDFLTKPVQNELLMDTVKRWTGSVAQKSDGAMHGRADATKADRRPAVFDPSVIAAFPMVADGSEPQYADELIAMFLESLTQTLQEIDQALRASDTTTLRRVLHSLKSSSATVGAMELAALAQTHENQLRQGKEPVAELGRIMALAVGRFRVAAPPPAQ